MPLRPMDLWSASFVQEGYVVVRELGFEGIVKPIPDGESAILSLVPGTDGKIYGLTHGRRSHLFVYNNVVVEDCVVPIGITAENVSGGDLFCTSKGIIHGVVWGEPAPEGALVPMSMFRYNPERDLVSSEMAMLFGRIEAIPCPFKGRRISRLAFDSSRDTAYGLFLPENILFAYEAESGCVTEVGCLGEGLVSKTLCVADGVVYGAGESGSIFRVDPDRGEIENTAMRLPCGKGKEYVNEAGAWAYDPCIRTIYGGTFADGFLFKIELDRGRVICVGRPTEQRPIRCLTVGRDGQVFGISGEPKKGICHLFRYDPETGDLRDLGIPHSTIVKCWTAHEIDAICTNRCGHIVMGENDRMSHLLVYYPAVEKRRSSFP